MCKGCSSYADFCFRLDACSIKCCFSGITFVSMCKWFWLVFAEHPVAILRALFCMACNFCVLVSDIIGDQTVQAYSSVGLIMVL